MPKLLALGIKKNKFFLFCTRFFVTLQIMNYRSYKSYKPYLLNFEFITINNLFYADKS